MRTKKTFMHMLVLAAAFLIPLTCLAGEVEEGTIIKTFGESYLYDHATGEKTKTTEGMRVSPGDIIETLDEATVIVDCNYDIVRLEPNTVAELVHFDGGKKGEGNTQMFLLSGMLYVIVQERKDDSLFSLGTAGSLITSRAARFTVVSTIADMPTDKPETKEVLSYIKKYGKVDKDTRVFSVDTTTTVYEGSVSLGIINPETKSTYPPVTIGEGEDLTNHFKNVVFGLGEAKEK